MVWNIKGNIEQFSAFTLEDNANSPQHDTSVLIISNPKSQIQLQIAKITLTKEEMQFENSEEQGYRISSQYNDEKISLLGKIEIIAPIEAENALSRFPDQNDFYIHVRKVKYNSQYLVLGSVTTCRILAADISADEKAETSQHQRYTNSEELQNLFNYLNRHVMGDQPLQQDLIDQLIELIPTMRYTAEEQQFVDDLDLIQDKQTLIAAFEHLFSRAQALCADNPEYAPFIYLLYKKCQCFHLLSSQVKIAELLTTDHYQLNEIFDDMGKLFFAKSNSEDNINEQHQLQQQANRYLLLSSLENPSNLTLLIHNLYKMIYNSAGSLTNQTGDPLNLLQFVPNLPPQLDLDDMPEETIKSIMHFFPDLLSKLALECGRLLKENQAPEAALSPRNTPTLVVPTFTRQISDTALSESSGSSENIQSPRMRRL